MIQQRGGYCLLELVVLSLALCGGFVAYQRFTAPSECDGWNGWTAASERRMEDTIARMSDINPNTDTRADLSFVADSIRRYAQN